MAVFVLDHSQQFPPVQLAEPDGLLAIGGDLSLPRLINAYKSGIFPWYDEPPILWWCPDPRFVLFPPELKISKSMRPVLNGKKFEFSVNRAFGEVIRQCGQIKRSGQSGTWINQEIIESYSALHAAGFAFSAESWENGQLVGGLYGVKMGKIFFGESMFSKVPNASKFAFINWVRLLQEEGIQLIDCQVYTEYLESLGAKMISRSEFLELLHTCLEEAA